MTTGQTGIPANSRILIVDDNAAIHEDIRRILEKPESGAGKDMRDLEAVLFGEDPATPADPAAERHFIVDSAFQGQEALKLVERALAEGSPYALAFMDIRMPPGWDGVETTEHLWKVDPNLQVVICTAFSDYSWEELIGRLGRSDRMVILKKPFDPVEVLQLANALTEKWRLTRTANLKLDELEVLVRQRTADLQDEIDEREKTQKELMSAKVAAEKANSAKSSFLANMSHEIRTPMNGVLGMCQLLFDTGLTAEQRELVKTLSASGDALLALINDVLDISKIEADKLVLDSTPFSVRELVEGVARLFAPKAEEKRLEFIAAIDPALDCRVMGDPARLRQVLLNLVSNAIKFTETGEVCLSATLEASTAESVVIRFRISDTGIGINHESFEQLFQPFTQADASVTRRFGGTGLGLTISKRVVEMMGGAIDVTSTPGKGSTFGFELAFTGASERDADCPAGTAGLYGMRALVIDDNATSRVYLRQMLAGWKLEVVEACDGEEGVRAFRAAHEAGRPLRFVLLDSRMPGLDGLQTAHRLRELPGGGNPRIALLTPQSLRPSKTELKMNGVDVCLLKPVRKQPLFDCLRDLPAGTNVVEFTPRQEDAGASANTAHTVAETMLKILVVDDNPVNQKVAALMLRRLGHQVQFAGNGAEAVALEERNAYDLILMDCQMPEMDGHEATRRIRARESRTGARKTPVIAMTAGVQHGDRDACIASGMDDYIPKPVKLETLKTALIRHTSSPTALAS